jgi:Fe2+ transport system protein FeoA
LVDPNNVHRLIQGKGIGQKFLGHLTENGGRVIGYLLEPTPARHAGIEDLAACRAVLQKLHDLGIAHGEICRKSFLIQEDGGGALLHGFIGSFPTSDRKFLAMEMARVEMVLNRPLRPNPTPPLPRELQEKVHALRKRDGDVHPVVEWEADYEGKITISQEEHLHILKVYKEDLDSRWMDDDMEDALESRQRNGGKWVPMVLRRKAGEQWIKGSYQEAQRAAWTQWPVILDASVTTMPSIAKL